MGKKEGTRELPSAIRPRPRGRDAPKLGGIEVSRDHDLYTILDRYDWFLEVHIDS